MSTTPGLNLPLIIGGAGGGEIANKVFTLLDAILGKGVEDVADEAPSGPSEGDAYIVSQNPTTGDIFEDHEGEIAAYIGGQWLFHEVAQGVRTYVRDVNKSIVKASSTFWSYATGTSVFFARTSSDFAYDGSGSWDTIDNWTQMQEVGTDELFDLVGSTGRCEVQDAGLYRIVFSGVVTPTGSLSTWEIGIGHQSDTAENPRIELASPALNTDVPFYTQLVFPAGREDDFYVAADRTSGSGGLTFKAGCSWYMELLSL